MTRDEIQAFFPLPGPPINFGAMDFEVAALGWFQSKAWPAFRVRLWNENLDKWIVRWECRDFARAFACFCLECWATTNGVNSTSDGLAIGEIWFIPDATVNAGHAICPVFTETGLQFIEPQTGLVYPMTAQQMASRYFLRF